MGIKLLPLSRSIAAREVINLLHKKNIEPKHCDKMHKKIIYFYYASLVYTVSKNGDKLSDAEVLPVGIILPIHPGLGISEIYCTDTGHFIDKHIKKKGVKPEGFELDELKIGTSIDDLKQYVATVWKSNSNYLDSSSILAIDIVVDNKFRRNCEYLKEKAKILNTKDFKGDKFDNRIFRAEVHVNTDINIDDIIFIINERNIILFKKEIESLNIKSKFLTYKTLDMMASPEVKANAINDRFIEYINEKYSDAL